MKKIWCFLLAGLVAAGLMACGSNPSPASDAGNPPAVENNAQETEETGQTSQSDATAGNDGEGTASSTQAEPPAGEETSNEESEEETNMQQNTFYVSVDGETFSATFADNSGAQALQDLLADGDVTLELSDYGGFEKVGPLGQSLPTSNSQTTTQAGDIVLYQGNQIVMFYGSNSWSYTRLGKIDDLTGWQEALGSGDITATFSLQGE